MKVDRLIRIIGTIDEAAFLKFSEELKALELENKSDTVCIELSSGGGTAYDALAFASRIRLSPCQISITAFGYVASAAVIILASGDRRLMPKESWVMVHEDSGKIKGDVVTMEREAKHYRRMENQWAGLLGDLTKADCFTWMRLHRETTYLSAQECLDIGLVDKII